MTDLSPAAQAVLNASKGAKYDDQLVADILRAAADHIDHDWLAFNCIDSLYEIAAELEGQ